MSDMTLFEVKLLRELNALTMAVVCLGSNHARQMEGKAPAYDADMIDQYVSALQQPESPPPGTREES
jgi:hypothetical protein